MAYNEDGAVSQGDCMELIVGKDSHRARSVEVGGYPVLALRELVGFVPVVLRGGTCALASAAARIVFLNA